MADCRPLNDRDVLEIAWKEVGGIFAYTVIDTETARERAKDQALDLWKLLNRYLGKSDEDILP